MAADEALVALLLGEMVLVLLVSLLPIMSLVLDPFFLEAALLVGLDMQYILVHNSGSSREKYVCSKVLSNPDMERLTDRKPHRFNLRTKLRNMTRRKYLGKICDENLDGSWIVNDLPRGSHPTMETWSGFDNMAMRISGKVLACLCVELYVLDMAWDTSDLLLLVDEESVLHSFSLALLEQSSGAAAVETVAILPSERLRTAIV